MNKTPATAMPVTPSNVKPSSTTISRRDFLSLAWKGLLGLSGLAGAAALLRFFSYQPDPPPQTAFDLGLPEQYLANSRTIIPQAEAVLIRTQNVFSAYSLVCTHLGCMVELKEQGYSCPCHGSVFNPDGSVKRGPADKPLRKLNLELTTDGRLILHTD